MEFIKEIMGMSFIGLIAGYSITLFTSKLNERRMQRRELQYLHNSLTFVLFVVFFPFIFSYAFLDTFPNIVNNSNFNIYLIVLGIVTVLQIINFIVIQIFTADSSKSKERGEISQKRLQIIIGISFIIAFSFALLASSFIITLYFAMEDVGKIGAVLALLVFYIALFLPYYTGLMKTMIKIVLVEVHLLDGKILSNLYLSHRSFGKELIFYDIDDQYQQKAVTISKDNILMILNIEHTKNGKLEETKDEMESFSSKVILNK